MTNGFEMPHLFLYYETEAGQSWVDRSREIVRCKDCEHFTPKGTRKFDNGEVNDDYCKFMLGWLVKATPSGYCAWGERKETK